jgi:hypothetical protein
MMLQNAVFVGALSLSFSFLLGRCCQAQMIEYDLVNQPEVELDPNDPSVPFKYKVQCPAGDRCYLQSDTLISWGPSPDENFRDGGWTVSEEESYKWFYFWNGAENITLDTMFDVSNNQPFISGDYCGGNSTCSIVCSDSCLCALEWTTPTECVVKMEYPNVVLPPRDERVIYEYLQPSVAEGDDGMTLQLRCPDFLNGCYVDADSFDSSSSVYDSNFDGFFALDYLFCKGNDEGTAPCRFGCDPGCTCALLNRADGTTSDCVTAPPTRAPTDGVSTEGPSSTPAPAGAASLCFKIVVVVLGVTTTLLF